MTKRAFLVAETDSSARELRQRLDAFYDTTNEYEAFQGHSAHEQIWSFIGREVARFRGGICRILEVGAGRTGFAAYLRKCGLTAHFTAQDVTTANESYLRENADEVVIGPLESVQGVFDIIFSTFVLEHMTDPVAALETSWKLLRPGGKLFISCPRYDMPFYSPHSTDHYLRRTRFGIALRLIALRLQTLFTRKPRFLVHTDPAVFTMPFRRDRDAVHWVSYFDLALFFKGRGRLTRLHLPAGSLKDRIVKSFLQVNVQVEKLRD